jgi:predicted transcriptional regulator
MSTAELRRRLVEKIQTTSDENILEEIYRILEVSSEEEDPIMLSGEQKAKIDKGLKDIEEGRYLTHDQANKEMEEWLKK